MKDPRWLPFRQAASKCRVLKKASFRVLSCQIDKIAQSGTIRPDDPFPLSWRDIQRLTGGTEWGCCEKTAYRHIKNMVSSGFISPTPTNIVNEYLRGKQSYNPAAVKFYNFSFYKKIRKISADKFAVIHVTDDMWRKLKSDIAATEEPTHKKPKTWD